MTPGAIDQAEKDSLAVGSFVSLMGRMLYRTLGFRDLGRVTIQVDGGRKRECVGGHGVCAHLYDETKRSEREARLEVLTDSEEVFGDFKELEKVAHASTQLGQFSYAFRHGRGLGGVARSGYPYLKLSDCDMVCFRRSYFESSRVFVSSEASVIIC